jgi:hypothetical protein
LEVFGRTLDRIKTLPALLIITYRPEFNAPWAGRSHVTSLALSRLGERETAAIITHLVGNKDLPAHVRRRSWSAPTAFHIGRTILILLIALSMAVLPIERGAAVSVKAVDTSHMSSMEHMHDCCPDKKLACDR